MFERDEQAVAAADKAAVQRRVLLDCLSKPVTDRANWGSLELKQLQQTGASETKMAAGTQPKLKKTL